MLALDALKKLMGPPPRASEAPNGGGWQAVERRLGIELPEDYKEFVTTYGTGAVDNFLWVLNPFSKNVYLNLFDEGKAKLDALRQLRDEFRENIPYAFYPDADGLFPWGVTDNGDVLYWLCNGRRASSLIVVNESRGPRWREFQLSTVEFLAALVTRELVVDVFPNDFPSESPMFVPLQCA